jgi:hypothetical protein
MANSANHAKNIFTFGSGIIAANPNTIYAGNFCSDGLNWTKVNSLIVANQLYSITYGNKMLLIGGANGLVLSSP